LRPFLRPTDRGKLAPVGWVSQPAGVWAGREVDVVYDPRRHTIILLRNQQLAEAKAQSFRDLGYERVDGDGHNELWARDRVAAARARLERADQRVGRTPSTGIQTPSMDRGLGL
jgi:hypothetical protein